MSDNSIEQIPVELSVVLGTARMPIHQLLRMGRGAVIELETHENDEVRIYANKLAIASGDVVVQGDKIAVSITETLTRDPTAP